MGKNFLELLAPAGKLEVLKAVAKAGADAVYTGGKQFNMRMLRTDFNLTRDEMKEALDFLHQNNKKLYITVNNLFKDKEMEGIEEYLIFLNNIGVDALIIQDLSILHIHKELSLKVPLHVSVQMGINNLESVNFLEKHGVQRIILSKNLSLVDINHISANSSLGMEYFVHGDMCVAHTGQCYMSSFIFGQSGNQGICLKPCRWKYNAIRKNDNTNLQGEKYFLAHNDLCLYPYLRELIQAGIISFKIEGRMRETEYIKHLVQIYRKELDRIINNQENFKEQQKDLNNLIEKRQRDFCSGSIYTKTSLESMGFNGEREPYFPTAPRKIKLLNEHNYTEYDSIRKINDIELTVKVNNLDSVRKLTGESLSNIIIDLETIIPFGEDENYDELIDVNKIFPGKLLLETPRIMRPYTFEIIKLALNSLPANSVYGFIVNDLGSMEYIKKLGFPVWSGYGLNINNSKAIQFLLDQGVERVTPSLELATQDIANLSSLESLELMIQGPLCGLITDLCIPAVMANDNICTGSHINHCKEDNFYLQDQLGQKYRIRKDRQCCNYIYFPYDIAALTSLPLIMGAGVKSLRIDGQFYEQQKLLQLIRIYNHAIENLQNGEWRMKDTFFNLLKIFPQGLSKFL